MSNGESWTFSEYVLNVMRAGIKLTRLRKEVRELLEVLYDESIYVYKIWFAVINYPIKTVTAICYDDAGEEFEVRAEWEFDHTFVSEPLRHQYILMDVVVE